MRKCENIRIEIVDTVGKISRNCLDCLEKLDELRLSVVEISSITGCILGDNLNLLDPLREHRLDFRDNCLDWARLLTTANGRYDTKGTVIIASLSYLQVFMSKWCMHISTYFIASPDECFFPLSRSFYGGEIV